jgi:hypothetical protein
VATQTWLGRFAIGTDNDTFTVDDVTYALETVTIASGKYFADGYTAEGANSLVVAINAAFDSTTNYKDASIAFDYTTGKFTLTFIRSTTLAFTDSALQTLLGMTDADIASPDTVFTHSNEAQYVWRPNRSLFDHPVDISSVVAPRSNTFVHVAKDGTTTSAVGSLLYGGTLKYTMLSEARAIIPSTGSVNREFEQFFKDVVHNGEHVRIFPDDTATTSSDYETVVIIGEEGGMVGTWGDFAGRHVANYNGLWDIEVPVRKVV